MSNHTDDMQATVQGHADYILASMDGHKLIRDYFENEGGYTYHEDTQTWTDDDDEGGELEDGTPFDPIHLDEADMQERMTGDSLAAELMEAHALEAKVNGSRDLGGDDWTWESVTVVTTVGGPHVEATWDGLRWHAVCRWGSRTANAYMTGDDIGLGDYLSELAEFY